MTRKGCIYIEQNNPGLRHGRGGSELHVYGTPSKRLRWVAEISYHGHRHRWLRHPGSRRYNMGCLSSSPARTTATSRGAATTVHMIGN